MRPIRSVTGIVAQAVRVVIPSAAITLAMMALATSPVRAQTSGPIPAVLFRFDPTYQAVVGGGPEGRHDPEDDARWAERRARGLTDFHRQSGSRVLRLIADYAGVPWPYEEIDVYVVRRFPTLSIQYPLTIAVGEIVQGPSRQEIPSGDFLVLTFAHQIAHYLLDPPPEELAADRPRALEHPLLEEGSFRRESLVNLIAYRALEEIWGRQRLDRAIAEPLWASYNPEAVFLDSLESRWTVSRSRPLVTWLLEEGEDGPVVRLAEAFESRRVGAGGGAAPGAPSGPPVGGGMAGTEVGFDVGQSADGRLFIAFLDRGSPAEAAGLRAGDIVLTIEGRRFSNVSEAMQVVENAWRTNGEVNLSVERQGKEVFFQVH